MIVIPVLLLRNQSFEKSVLCTKGKGSLTSFIVAQKLNK